MIFERYSNQLLAMDIYCFYLQIIMNILDRLGRLLDFFRVNCLGGIARTVFLEYLRITFRN
jgi:hypothetical protein